MDASQDRMLIRRILESTFEPPSDEGPDKTTSLSKAIRENVKPGMSLHVSDGANALVCELLRQFFGSRPDFTLITVAMRDHSINLMHAGLVRKLIVALSVATYPNPGPSHVIQRLYRAKSVEIENWSLHSLTQRLLAGACGYPFVPSKSIAGSSMAEVNRQAFTEIPDPFGGASPVGLVRSLNPDLALVHAWAADRSGNTILAPSLATGEGAWGAKAARQGVLVSVERIVPRSFIREHQHLVSIPGHMVMAVTAAPMGAHPRGMSNNYGVPEFESYADDYEFMAGHRNATKTPGSLDEWTKEWVLVGSHEEYLAKLGRQRTAELKSKAGRDDWKRQIASALPGISTSESFTPREAMIVATAHKLKQRIESRGYRVLLSGAGAVGIASWIAYYDLKKQGEVVELLVGSGCLGLSPRPGDPLLFSLSSIRTCTMLSDVINAYGVVVGGPNSSCLAALSAGQIDSQGNLNSTIMPGDVYLTGSGGANDAVTAREVVAVMPQSKERLVPKVPYITCPGNRVTALVTDLGIFERTDGSGFILTEYLKQPGISEEESIARIRANCGWELLTAPGLAPLTPPTREELVLLRLFDPEGHFRK